jgi:hypothetical protein
MPSLGPKPKEFTELTSNTLQLKPLCSSTKAIDSYLDGAIDSFTNTFTSREISNQEKAFFSVGYSVRTVC